MIISILFIAVFYGICIFGICCDNQYMILKQLHKDFSWRLRLALGIVLVTVTIFVVYWIRQNHFIYYWDYSGYWRASIDRMNEMKYSSCTDILKTLIQSINNDDYNIFLPTVIAFPLDKLGYTFARYVIVCCMMFLIPVFLIEGLIVQKFVKDMEGKKGGLYVISVIIAICMANNYYAVFKGYIDGAYLVPMSVVLYLFIDYDFKKKNIARNIAISLLLVMIWICRRYTVFFLIGFVIAMLIKAITVVIQTRNLNIIKSVVFNFLQIGGVSFGILFFCFRQFFLHALLTNYGEMYSAYDAPLMTKINTLALSFGYITGIISVIVGIVCFLYKKHILNYVALIALVLIETAVFWKTQDMSIHHRMLLNIPLYIISTIPIAMSWDLKHTDYDTSNGKKYIVKICAVFCACSMMINFLNTFSKHCIIKNEGKIFSEHYEPLQRHDIEKLNYLAERLNQLVEGTEDRIYVAASGTILNCDILRKLYMPYSQNAVPQMDNTCDVDLRDGFPTWFLDAKYVVATDPVQTHLDTGQEVVTYLAEQIMNNETCIGKHFECIEQVELDDGVIAKIYSKESDFTAEDLEQIRKYYMELYPEYKELFADRIYYN